MFRKKPSNQGFTLMELLIVMVILSILVAIATGAYASSSRRGRDNRRKNDLRSLSTALETYFGDKGRYPSGTGGVIMGCGSGDTSACPWGDTATGFRDQYGTLYMVLMPQDPLSTQTYYYVSSGTDYKIYTKLENVNDAGDGVDQDGYSGTDCSITSTVECTYGIASSNTKP